MGMGLGLGMGMGMGMGLDDRSESNQLCFAPLLAGHAAIVQPYCLLLLHG